MQLLQLPEGQGIVVLNITIFQPPPGGNQHPFTLVVNAEANTAGMVLVTHQIMHMQFKTVSGAPHSDYNAVNGEILQFNVGDTYQTHTIIINDDIDCEDDSNENFFSVIALNDGVQPINVNNPRATITIDDSDEVECSKYILLNSKSKQFSDVYFQLWLKSVMSSQSEPALFLAATEQV